MASSFQNMTLPVPPQGDDVAELKRYSLSLHNTLQNLFLNGNQIFMTDTDQLTAMTTENKLSQVGKLFYNTTNDTYYRTRKSGTNLIVETW